MIVEKSNRELYWLEEGTKIWWLGEAAGINNGLKMQQGMILIGGRNQDLFVGGSNRNQ
jgi:hypothetical protein